MDIENRNIENVTAPHKNIVIFLCLAALLLIGNLISKGNIPTGLIISLSPLILLFLILMITTPFVCFITLFTFNYLISSISRYTSAYIRDIPQIGLITDILIVTTFLALIIRTCFKKDIEWKRSINTGLFLLLIWTFYCIAEDANKTGVHDAWIRAIRSYALYPISFFILYSVIIDTYKKVKYIAITIAAFTFLATAKLAMQIFSGFDYAEHLWLNSGAWKTHLLSSGIRYFSIFTDAGNFGSNMGFILITFGILFFYEKKKALKILYLITSACGLWGLLASGTRGSLAVPLAGLIAFTFLSKKFKLSILSTILLAGSIIFLSQTNMGNSNQYIRRMRSAFNKEDPSFIVRKNNQKKLKKLLEDKPFGEGLGMMGNYYSAKYSNSKISKIPPDSWYVKIWADTGITGLLLYIIIQILILGIGTYYIFFKIKNKELNGYLSAFISGLFGLLVSAYGNAFYTQYPTLLITSMIQAMIFASLYYDKELQKKKITE